MTVTRAHVIELARGWLGTPYHHRASIKGAGCDCIGLIQGLWREIYGTEPESPGAYTGDWAEATGSEALLSAAGRHLAAIPIAMARPGDILVFRLRANSIAKHAAILSATGRMIHAQERVAVSEVTLGTWWRRRIAGTFVLPGIAD